MTRLLVSVRDANEARLALAAGADLIDVKEPARGSLGRADDEAITAVLHEVAACVPVSAALGELRDWPGDLVRESTLDDALRFAKLGLAGCASLPDWPARWANALRSVAPRRTVAVIYADWQVAEAPSPHAVLAHARRHGCGAVLVDTFDKRAGGLLDHWRIAEVRDAINHAQSAGMLAVIAGSLDGRSIPQILSLSPDYVAVRGAVCRGGRTGPLDGRSIEELRSLVVAKASTRTLIT
jgi:uncharacterized protein (UPF0264 family)